MWPYSWTHVGTPSHLGHMDWVAATMPSQAHAGAAQEAPNIGQWEGQDVPLVRPSSCIVKGGIPSSRRYLPTYLIQFDANRRIDDTSWRTSTTGRKRIMETYLRIDLEEIIEYALMRKRIDRGYTLTKWIRAN